MNRGCTFKSIRQLALGVLSLMSAGLPLSAHAATPNDLINVDLSGNLPLAAAVPVVAVDPNNSKRVAVAWRFVDPMAARGAALKPNNWGCHVSTSEDGGNTFKEQAISWGVAQKPRCNAPYVGFSAQGDLYIAASVMGDAPAHATEGAPAAPNHPVGVVAFAISRDQGRTWSPTLSEIGTDMLNRFETDASIPVEAKQVPWDGARGAVDLKTATIYLTGAYPAPPGGTERSQRFYNASTDGGKTFGSIRSFGNAQWPEWWDGDIAAAQGELVVSYLGQAAPDASKKCPCAVVGISHDAGRTLEHHLIADSSELDVDTLVHYPEVAADNSHQGRFALVLISADKIKVSAYLTNDDGKTWQKITATQPADVASVTRPAVSFSSTGALIIAWRGEHADKSYDIYAAASADGKAFGASVKVSTQTSHFPEAWIKTYALRGDFHTSLAADKANVHVSWADARSGVDLRAYYGRLPISTLLKGK